LLDRVVHEIVSKGTRTVHERIRIGRSGIEAHQYGESGAVAIMAPSCEVMLMMKKLTLLAILGAFGLAGACAGGEPVDGAQQDVWTASPSRGLDYARQVCADCHAVEQGQDQSPNPNAPPFELIANTPGMTATALNAWLHTPHPSMPNLVVDPSSRDDINAYLQSLKRGSGRG
jgi:mono/diheme cytochrome c family protein